ncbi:MAG: hypothetical protein EOO47_09130 [Flavobacterium sp.]|nr:MAG: hypothetical protein EOO47_09130 [Flavobacterium sp.]
MKTILLQLLKDTKLDLTKAYLVPSGGSGDLNSKFDLTPKNFLRFAKQDLQSEDDRGIINSLTNSKRAIDCQTDEALEKCGIKSNDFDPDIKKFVEHFDLAEEIPIKLKIIHALNLAPSILISKTRTIRNKLEHFYQKPTINEAKEALDVADLFIRSVEGKFRMLINDFALTDEKNFDNNDNWSFINGLNFSFVSDKRNFSIQKIISKKSVENIDIDCNYIEYYGLLRLMFSIDDDIDLEETLKVLLKQLEHPMPTEKVSLIEI